MNKNLSIIYGVLILILVVFSAYTYHENQVLNCRVNSLKSNSVDFKSEKTFKEDYYITQQNRDTTLLLVIFPLIVGLTSYLTYQNLRSSFESRILEMQTENEKNKAEYDIRHKEIDNLKFEFNFETSLLQGALSKDYYDKGLIEDSFIISLRASAGFALCASKDDYINRIPAKNNLLHELAYLEEKTKGNQFELNWSYIALSDCFRKVDNVLEGNQIVMFNKIKARFSVKE